MKWSDDRKTTANRVLWIRKTVIIPSALKSEFEKTGLLTLSLGKILQSDNTYLNGKLIGATGSGDTYRNYLDGGQSYPNHIALQRGPQVLAFDENIHGFEADSVTVDSKDVQLQNANGLLPKQWIGGAAFRVKASIKSSTPKSIVLVPYAYASQTGGAIATWIKKKQ